jgi:hypothetical protein
MRALFVLVFISLALAQQPPAPAAAEPTSAVAAPAPDISEFVRTQFGTAFTLVPGFTPLTGDLDNDGIEDVIIVARAKDPLLDAITFNYKVIDPYDAYFGFGDPKITAQFNVHDPNRARLLLIVHSWRATAPTAKFVLINLPFEKLALSRVMVKKKVRPAISAEEQGGLSSSVYWDGKKYKWQASASSSD